jgi:hypothetical protein
MSSTKSPKLLLDPGRSRPRRAPSFWRFCRWLILVIIVIFFGWFIYQGVSDFRKSANPHRDIFHNGTIEEANSADYIKPLIDREQRFDIAVTVWLRATEEEERIHRDRKQTNETDIEGMKVENEDDLLETPLYSNIAFRGARMTDKGLRTMISFDVPTARL